MPGSEGGGLLCHRFRLVRPEWCRSGWSPIWAACHIVLRQAAAQGFRPGRDVAACALFWSAFSRLFGRVSAQLSVAPGDVIGDQLLEVARDTRTAQRHRLLAVDEHRCARRLAGTRKRET